MTVDTIRAAAGNVAGELATLLDPRNRCERRNMGLLVAAGLCAVLPLDVAQLASALVGVAAYMLIQSLQPDMERAPGSKTWRSMTS
eukprot:CAMPEP_0168404876 /NCGR_PEP_ID=MMETSP0228-20121227/24860_1 /TAXON_ID=133427 /ORGANISM="Protoceratium reticulatum, Strain CCCM 535 (=CCMP 1889)" /LENGTH=85 /DNA_ID=CAMNT_0008418503 /DNA_START=104 /DNA_END=358 /DNA_ORIENTATION=-